MKKLGLTLGLCLIASVSFGQKKAVSEALRFAKDAKPNFEEARKKIKGALEHDETKNDAKTWYTAGQIEDMQFTAENTKLMLGQQPNEAVMYDALLNVYPYFRKANELDNLPDAKGKVKPKFTKDIRSTLKANLVYYLNGGAYFFDQRDYKKTLDFFNQYIEIADSKLMKEGVKPGEAPVGVDSVYLLANYYAAIAASQLNDHPLAIEVMARASKLDYKKNDMLQYLAEEYRIVGDTVNFKKTLEDGIAIFPKEDYFIMSLVSLYITSEEHEKAVEYLNTAIKNDPSNAQLYDVAGRIYESGLKDYEKAEEFFKKSIELDSENAESQSDLGRIYFNQGVIQLDEANNISDVKKYNEEKEKAKELFRKALPCFEKAYQLNPDDSDSKQALRSILSSIYYNLEMGDKLEEMNKLMNGSN
ncbi:MAG: tetratricopeptide repeat protein [Tannerella sp.]|jgi:tetratricopeptide (TPR) repeat protein|nr:tetratricopeptide repeat protein [Tannerella sp.]